MFKHSLNHKERLLGFIFLLAMIFLNVKLVALSLLNPSLMTLPIVIINGGLAFYSGCAIWEERKTNHL